MPEEQEMGVTLEEPVDSPDPADVTEEEQPPSHEGQSAVAADAEVDEDGVPYRNRFEEQKRKYEEADAKARELEQQIKVQEYVRSQIPQAAPAPQQPIPQGPDYFKRLEEAGIPTEAGQVVAEMISDAQRTLMQSYVQPAQMQTLEAQNQLQLDAMLTSSENEHLKPYRDEVMAVLRTADVTARMNPGIVTQAMGVVFMNHKDAILRDVAQKAKEEAKESRTINNEVITGSKAPRATAQNYGLTDAEVAAAKFADMTLKEYAQFKKKAVQEGRVGNANG